MIRTSFTELVGIPAGDVVRGIVHEAEEILRSRVAALPAEPSPSR